ncbi:MAG: YkgJ family cysteine cluster protein [Anaerolineae bacterium]
MDQENNALAVDNPSWGSSKQLDQVAKDLLRGLQFTNLLGSITQEQNTANTILLQSLLELLIAKGEVHVNELEERKKAVAESLAKSNAETPHVQLTETPDKYETEQFVGVDCAGHKDVCQMICCKLWFVISVQDLTEGIIKWNCGMPYSIAQDEDGYCVHLDRCKGCLVYSNRPLVCRAYDCRSDRRIWLDYDNKILNPEAIQAIGSHGSGMKS